MISPVLIAGLRDRKWSATGVAPHTAQSVSRHMKMVRNATMLDITKRDGTGAPTAEQD